MAGPLLRQEGRTGYALESVCCCSVLLVIGLGGWAFLVWHLLRLLRTPFITP